VSGGGGVEWPERLPSSPGGGSESLSSAFSGFAFLFLWFRPLYGDPRFTFVMLMQSGFMVYCSMTLSLLYLLPWFRSSRGEQSLGDK
jgi:hypothetical protein